MFNKVREFYLLFNKVNFNSKITLMWLILFPLLTAILYNMKFLSEKPSESVFLMYFGGYIALIIILTAFNVCTNIIQMREQGFLKRFFFITGSKLPIIIGLFLSFFTIAILSISTFTICSSILFLGSTHLTLKFWLLGVVLLLVSFIPITFLCLFLLVLPIKQESLITFASIIMFLLFMTSFNNSLSIDVPAYLSLINPVNVVLNLENYLMSVLFQNDFNYINMYFTILLLGVYLTIGFYSYKSFKITALNSRS
ncbi:hypothetical protein [Cytobacillus sp. IB215665]|uniref:hypothetical protein n=1 Tax=Cytobacillus sp. IB215665 TaxID=3097357 RepID=UPI002A0FEE8C|nr:hypothetical protein [Cytobacillus sp. IB215665]MDX8365391.1 hypothetical protein [Cytobacillus sp. IB215665]